MNWIWLEHQENNSFAEFELPFFYREGVIELRISADYQYAAYIEEQVVSFGQCADLPEYKCVNRADLTPYVKPGKNILCVVAWHMGVDHSVCRTMTAGVAFEIIGNGQVIAQSDRTTRCRPARGYRGGDQITSQLGMGVDYDFCAEVAPWETAREVSTIFTEVGRPIKNTVIGETCASKIIAQGIFQYRGGNTSAERMQNAWLSTLRFGEMTGKDRSTADTLTSPLTFAANGGDGLFVIADLGRETCGHLSLCVSVKHPCTMLLGWGEHLSDLRVRTYVGGRNFGMKIDLQAGENRLDDDLLRLGCRYLCIYAETDQICVTQLGIREVGYPFCFPEKDFGDRLLNAIYETGRRTLYLSSHEHYEDCPWREQALYGMDSRNQMLFGYGAFEEYDYPRANLMLIARSQEASGLIPLTAPARMSITIPSFTAYWLIAIAENAEVDYNEPFLREIMPGAKRGLSALLAQERAYGLSVVTEPHGWNFHEWAEGLDGGVIFRDKPIAEMGDAGLTALTVIAARKLATLQEMLGDMVQAEEYRSAADRLTAALECYYDEARGQYASYLKENVKQGYHEYIQALILLAGGVPKERVAALCARLKSPLAHDLIPATLSTLQLKYQALIEQGDAMEYCVEDVVRIFGKMLFEGATAYYETELGEADFGDAGSLCHGWSAVGCWVLDKYQKHQKE